MFEGIRFQAKVVPQMGRIAKYKPDATYTTADILEERTEASADHPFVLFEDRSVSYGEMNFANRIAHWAHQEGLGSGDGGYCFFFLLSARLLRAYMTLAHACNLESQQKFRPCVT